MRRLGAPLQTICRYIAVGANIVRPKHAPFHVVWEHTVLPYGITCTNRFIRCAESIPPEHLITHHQKTAVRRSFSLCVFGKVCQAQILVMIGRVGDIPRRGEQQQAIALEILEILVSLVSWSFLMSKSSSSFSTQRRAHTAGFRG